MIQETRNVNKKQVKDKFRLNDGLCSLYAHVCGYIDEYKQDGYILTLFLDGTYHVKVSSKQHGSVIWDVFEADERTTARARFKKVRTHLRKHSCISTLA